VVPTERVLSVTRRHFVTLVPTGVICALVAMAAVAAGLSSPDGGGHLWLSYEAAGFVLLASLVFALRIWRWKFDCCILTDQRLLFVEGLVARRVHGLRLRDVLDTTYRRSVPGRLFGYADITLNLSGQPGLRTLRKLSRPETLYSCILWLTAVRHAEEPPWPPAWPPPPGPSWA
jgi:hypothetical protein